mmetsp:Transcript_48171/g.98408  ORF Transcript_48171/g.98408 Transcript_48171/m.98408 type:complete len:320 (+) Transcript_48171:167-1126(+)
MRQTQQWIFIAVICPFLACDVVDAFRNAGVQYEFPYQGEDEPGHLGPEVSTWELDHLVLSSQHTGVSLFVSFYSPKQRQSKRLIPMWDGVINRFAGTPTVKILTVNCDGFGRMACKDHNVKSLPSLQHFQPGFSHGEVYSGHLDQYHLEQWVLKVVEHEHREAAEIEYIEGCRAFRQTADCDPAAEREPWHDRSCIQEVPAGVSGYCECGEGDERAPVTCVHEPFNCHDVCVPGDECVAWRQTGECRADGPREASADLPCRREVPKGASGFCECTHGRKTAFMTCWHHGSFTCESKCRELSGPATPVNPGPDPQLERAP